MGFGRYRFRRSFGQVGSQFRGARPDTYPLLSYVKDGLALAYEALSSLIIPDKSGNGNDATLYTGRYFSTDGSTDKGIVADCSAAGSGSYYLTGKIKPSGTTQAKATINGSALNLSGLNADVWQDFTTNTKTSVTPDTVAVGWNGGGNYSAADWSDVRLIDASDDSVVGRWQGSDSSEADLDGYPALDSSGNGYHGTHVGCAGGSEEGINPYVAGIVGYDDKMWLDGVDDYVALGSVQTLADGETWEITLVTSDASNNGRFFGQNNNDYISLRSSGNIRIESNNINYDFTIGDQFADNTPAVFKISRSGDDYTVYIDDASKGTLEILTGVTFNSISDPNGVSPYVGILQDFKINGVLQWDGTIEDAESIGTVNGSPVTVAEKRATILQTAGEDWSKAYLYDDTANEYIELDSDLTFSGDFRIRIQFYTTSNSTYQGLAGYEPFAANEGYISIRNDRLRINDGVTIRSFNTTVPNQEPNICEFRRSSGTLSAYLNDSLIGSASTSETFSLNMLGGMASATNNLNGAIFKVSLNTSADSDTWTNEWNGEGKAITGSNDGTLVGTPDALLIPESTTAGLDALGNAIDNPRVNNEVINLFGDGEYAQIPAVGDVRSITLAIYNDGTTKDIVVDSLSAGFISIASNVVSSADAGTFYVNGAATTTLSAGWNIVGITYTADTSGLNSATIEATSGSLLAYEPSKSLTADEQLQNYNAFKSKYGL